ncbi:MAG: hypothetical protein KGJ06_03315, partial [Pseudomonadota bacterium]|nr:hypothetical protein [Pseudomonadota bacterium]
AEFLEHKAKIEKGEIVQEFRFVADFQTISLPYLPIEILQKHVFENLSTGTRVLIIFNSLAQAIQTLHKSAEMREQLIQNFKTTNLSQKELLILYFGIPYNGGHINNEYPSSIENLFDLTNNTAFFSYLLCRDLVKHGRRLARRFKIRYGKNVSINRPDFAKAINSGLMPKESDYAEWLGIFKTSAKRPKKTFFARIRNKWYWWHKRGLA